MTVSMVTFASWIIEILQPVTRRKLIAERMVGGNYAIFAEYPRTYGSSEATPLKIKLLHLSTVTHRDWTRKAIREKRLYVTINGKSPKFEGLSNPSKEKARYVSNLIQEELPFLRISPLNMLLSGFEEESSL